MFPFASADLTELAARLRSRDFSAVELLDCHLEQLHRREPEIGACITQTEDTARSAAQAADERLAAGDAPLLCGIPFGLKDNICTEGIPTTCASRMLASYVPPYSATAYERLREAGAVLVAKCNMDEFAMGSSTENSAFHPTRNPLDLTRVPGGSSGGPAAAVAAGEVSFSLGSDTGGSIRQPAAFCGLVGMKPTYGTVSRHGLVAFASSLDQIGPLTRSIRDNVAVLRTIVGPDTHDSTCRLTPDLSPAALQGGIRGLRIGLAEFPGGEADSGVLDCITQAATALERAGAQLCHLPMPALADALPAYYILSSAEASSNLARYDGLRYGARAEDVSDPESLYCRTRTEFFGPEVRRRILLGTYVLSAGHREETYLRAQAAVRRIRAAFSAAFSCCDVLLCPTAPTVAFPLGSRRDPLSMYRGDIYSVAPNLAGIPALSVPCGRVGGLPVGAQLMGKACSEALLYRVGAAIEEVCR